MGRQCGAKGLKLAYFDDFCSFGQGKMFIVTDHNNGALLMLCQECGVEFLARDSVEMGVGLV